MLKGLKIKTLSEKEQQKRAQDEKDKQMLDPMSSFKDQLPEEKTEIKEKTKKRWKKDKHSQKSLEQPQQYLVKQEISIDDQLTQLKLHTQKVWDNFIQNNQHEAFREQKKLFDLQETYYDRIFKSSENQQTRIQLFEENAIEQDEKIDYKLRQNPWNSNIRKEQIQSKLAEKNNCDKAVLSFYRKFKTFEDNEEIAEQEYDQEEKEDNEQKQTKKEKKKEKKRLEKQQKMKIRERKEEIKVISRCKLCIANHEIWNEQIISYGKNILLIIPLYQRYKKTQYFQLVPINHVSASVELEEDEYEELMHYKQQLIKAFQKQNKGVIFFESALELDRCPHAIVEGVVIPFEDVDECPLYFKKSITEMESEWNVHKKIIEIRKELGGLKKQIPKNFSYFYVDFNQKFGYAHVIEQEGKFNKMMPHENLAAILELEQNEVIRAKQIEREKCKQLKNSFMEIWNSFEFNS